ATAYDVHEALQRASVNSASAAVPSALTDGYGGDLDPAVSSAGSRLVFSSSRTGGERKLWTAALDGSDAQPLTSGTGFDDRPAVSPDGRQIAYLSDRGGRRAIWIISSDGGAPRKLVDAQSNGGVSW